MSYIEPGSSPSLGDVIKEYSAKKEQARKEWEESLGPPFIFIANEETKGHGVGFFRQGDNVLVIPKYSNGYSQNSCRSFNRDFIEMLVATLNSPAKPT